MHRIVKDFYALIPKDKSIAEFSRYHGLNENTVRTWRRKANPVSPQVAVLDDILNKMGYRLIIERKDSL